MYKVLLAVMRDWDSLLELPALLSNGGCTVDVYCPRHFWVLKNRFVARWIEADTSDGIFIRTLLEYIDEFGNQYDWILPADDVVVRHLNRGITSDALFRKVMPLLDPSLRGLLGSKIGLARLCEQHRIASPRFLIRDQDSTYEQIRQTLGAPFLIKEDESESGLGVHLCTTAEDFDCLMAKTSNKKLIFQQYIAGTDLNIEALYKSGRLIVYSYSETLKSIGAFGVSTQRTYHHNRGLEQELTKIGAVFGLSGFANILFRRDIEDGRAYLVEVDMRPNAWMMYARFAGSDFSAGVRKIVRGDLTLLPPARLTGGATKIVLYYRDLRRCVIERDYSGLMDWLLNRDRRWRYVPLYDLRTLLATTRRLFTTFRETLQERSAVQTLRGPTTVSRPSPSLGTDHVLLPPIQGRGPRSF